MYPQSFAQTVLRSKTSDRGEGHTTSARSNARCLAWVHVIIFQGIASFSSGLPWVLNKYCASYLFTLCVQVRAMSGLLRAGQWRGMLKQNQLYFVAHNRTCRPLHNMVSSDWACSQRISTGFTGGGVAKAKLRWAAKLVRGCRAI